MALDILFIIATWFIYNGSVAQGLNLLPLPVAILITVFGSLSALVKLIRFVYRNYKDKQDGTWGKF